MQFGFEGKLWKWQSTATAWYFLTLPKDKSAEIKFFSNPLRKGFGSVKVTARIGDTEWNTSIFPSTAAEAYLLPVKAAIRKKNKIGDGDKVEVEITTVLD